MSPSDLSPQAEVLTLQFVNILLLLAAVAVICCWTKDKNVTWWYMVAVCFADWGHIYGVYRGVGKEVFWDVKGWNDMTWGSVGGSAFLHVNRLLTLAGVFGRWWEREKSA